MRARSRRGSAAVLAAALLAGAGPAPADPVRSWHFRVLLDGDEIGWHRYELEDSDRRRVLSSEADFEVDFLFITAFDYRHTTVERWHQGCLAALDASTVQNGRRLEVNGRRHDDHFVVQREGGSDRLPACVMTFAYWNPAFLEQTHLLNPQTGEYLQVETERVGSEPLVVKGERVNATRYRLRAGELVLDVWYSPDDDWLALESLTAKGRTLRYELT